jgi:pimeloyl-ACP methyl ester carboxylesterase
MIAVDQGPRTPVQHRRVAVGDLVLSVAEYAGEGPPLFLLHGIGSSAASWWPVIDALAERFRVYAPDWRGHGASDKPECGYAIADYARDLDALLDAYGYELPLVMGHSLGGMISLSWAKRHPAKARRLVIEDSPLRRHEDPQTLFDGWIALATQPVEVTAAHYKTQNPNWTKTESLRRAQNLASTNLAVFTELRDASLTDHSDRISPLSAIESPTLLVYGDVDTRGMVPAEDAVRFAATLPNASIVRIPGGTHSLHRDHRDEFLEIVLPFLLG